MYRCIYMHVYIYITVYIYMYTYTYICAYFYIYICKYTYTSGNMYTSYIYIYIYIWICIYIYIRASLYIYIIYIHICIYIRDRVLCSGTLRPKLPSLYLYVFEFKTIKYMIVQIKRLSKISIAYGCASWCPGVGMRRTWWSAAYTKLQSYIFLALNTKYHYEQSQFSQFRWPNLRPPTPTTQLVSESHGWIHSKCHGDIVERVQTPPCARCKETGHTCWAQNKTKPNSGETQPNVGWPKDNGIK